MKKKLLLASLAAVVLLGVLGAALFLTSAETSAKVTLELEEDKTYEIGDEVTVLLNFANVDFDVNGFTASLSWDPAKLQATEFYWGEEVNSNATKAPEEGDLAKDISSQTFTLARGGNPLFSNKKNAVYTAGTVAEITFKVLEGASAENAIEVSLESFGASSSDNHASEVAVTGATVKVNVPEKSTVIFIADKAKGTGDGLSAANAMGNSAEWQAVLDANATTSGDVDGLMTGSSLHKAFVLLKETGGTVVVVDDVTVAYGSKAQDGGTNNFYLREEVNNTYLATCQEKPITITSVYDGVDYRSTNGAEFVIRSLKQTTRLHFFGDTTMENLDITCITDGTRNTNISFRGFVGVLGEGLNMRTTTDVNHASYDATPTKSALPRVYGAAMWSNTGTKEGRSDAVNLTILSGSYYTFSGGGNFPNGACGVTGDVNITIGEATITGYLNGGYETSLNANDAGYVKGDINITLNGTYIPGAVYGSTSSTAVGGSVTDAVSQVTGNINLTINPGTVIEGYVMMTPNATASTGSGRVTGNINVTVNGTDSKNPITFKSIHLGRQGFVDDSGKFTVKVNGDYWNASDWGYWSGSAYTIPPIAFFSGYLTNFAGSYQNMTLDFSGMTYDEFWAHKNHSEDTARGKSFDTPLYQAFYYVGGKGVAPTEKPGDVTLDLYGIKAHAKAGYTEFIEPTSSPLASIAVKTAGTTAYTEGQTFDVTGFTFTGTRENSSTFDIAGTDAGLSFTPSGALALTDKKVTVTYKEKTVDIDVTVNEKPVKSVAAKTNGTTTYTEGQTFDPSGFTFTVTYEDDTTKDIAGTADGVTFAPATALTTSDTKVTVTYGGKTVDVDVTVNAKKATGIAVKTEGKKEYMAGETFDPSSYVFTVTFEDSSTEEVNGSDERLSFTPSGALSTDVTTVTVGYKSDVGVGVNVTVTPAPKTLIALAATGTYKTGYFSGEKFDPTGLTFTATMKDTATEATNDETLALSDLVFTPALTEALKASDTEVTASYTYAGVTKTAPITVTVSDPALQSIAITVAPTQTEYWAGETFKATGLKVTADFDYDALDGEVALNDLTLTPADGATLTTSITELTVSYTVGSVTKTATVALTVKDPTLQSISVKAQPTVTSYFKGEALTIDGLEVEAIYDKTDLNGVVGNDALSFTPAVGTALTTGDATVTVSYTVGSVTKTATFAITVEEVKTVEVEQSDVPATLSQLNNGDKITAEDLAKSGLTVTVNGKKVKPTADQITIVSPAGGVVDANTDKITVQITIGDSTFEVSFNVSVSAGRSLADQMMDNWAMWYIRSGKKFPIFPED